MQASLLLLLTWEQTKNLKFQALIDALLESVIFLHQVNQMKWKKLAKD